MSKNIIKTHNITTGEIIEEEMTADELKLYEEDLAQRQLLSKTKKDEEDAKKAARLAVLTKLGLTAEDLKALGL